MKTCRLIFAFSALILLGCRKSDPSPAAGYSKNYSQSSAITSNSGGSFSFTSIEVNPNPVRKGNVAKVIAHATGSHLTYSWSTPHGDLFGTGAAVYYSDSCVGTFQIICTVSDGSNTSTLTVDVTIVD
jgi:hypothetical protein